MPPRFNVVPKEERTLNGRVFASKREMLRWAKLELLVRAGEISDLEYQPSFKVFINGKLLCTYTADAGYIIVRTQERVVEDTKSSGTRKDPYYRLRKKAAELQYGVTIVEVGK